MAAVRKITVQLTVQMETSCPNQDLSDWDFHSLMHLNGCETADAVVLFTSDAYEVDDNGNPV